MGSLIGLEIVHLLEAKGHIGHVTIIDGGTVLMKKLALKWMQDSDRVFETALIIHLLTIYLPSEKFAEYQVKYEKHHCYKT